MASLTPPLPSALTSILSTLLPCGFAVGPSRFCEGRLGLWWVGCMLKPGSLLGRDGDLRSSSVHQSERMKSEATVCCDSRTSQTGCTEETKELMLMAANKEALQHMWISFACQVQSREQQNVVMQCACGEDECVCVRLRVCRDIHPGTELLLCRDTVGKLQAGDETTVLDTNKECGAGKMEAIKELQSEVTNTSAEENITEEENGNKQKSPRGENLHGKQRTAFKGSQPNTDGKKWSVGKRTETQSERTSYPAAGRVDRTGDQTDSTGDRTGVQNETNASGGHTDRTGCQRDVPGCHRDSTGDAEAEVRQVCSAPPALRCSSRLAAKPRRVHRIKGRANRDPAEQTGGRSLIATEATTSAAGPKVALTPDGEGGAEKQSEVRERRHRCSSCGKKFFQIGHLKKHQFSHTEEKPFSCSECGKNYTSAESFRAHQMSHRGERPFSCPHCEKTYGLKRDLKEHLVLHTGEKPYACDHCGKAFARRPSLRIHRLLHCSRMTYTQPPKIQCTLCPKLLANSGSLRNHMKLHTGEKPHVCQHCGKCFSQKGNLESHLRIHNGEKPFSCTECQQSFSQKPELRRHMFSHTGGGFLCSYCGKSLRDPHSLKAHERLHTGDRPHRCLVCGKGYTLATKLRRHIKSSHVMDKPFSCHCGASYSVKQSLLRHQAQHRSEGGAPEQVVMEAAPEGGTDHPKPIRGRPRKKPLLQTDGEPRVGREKRKQARAKVEVNVEENYAATRREEGEDTLEDRIQHAVVYVRADDPSAPGADPLQLGSERPLPAGTGQELVEVVLSEGQEQCIMVHGQHPVGELLILQEDESGLCSVAQTVEINTV
eukprot:XP_011608116.1 PREDICTED: zinc finger protein 408 [Takifugu rubripes]